MKNSTHTLLLRIFRDMPDQRMPGKIVHKLHDILVITVCFVIFIVVLETIFLMVGIGLLFLLGNCLSLLSLLLCPVGRLPVLCLAGLVAMG